MAFQKRGDHRRNFNHSEMFDAVCAKCGAACQVPFRPNGKKDVLCSNCFKANHENSPESHHTHSSFSHPHSGKELENINSKLDRILQLLSHE